MSSGSDCRRAQTVLVSKPVLEIPKGLRSCSRWLSPSRAIPPEKSKRNAHPGRGARSVRPLPGSCYKKKVTGGVGLLASTTGYSSFKPSACPMNQFSRKKILVTTPTLNDMARPGCDGRFNEKLIGINEVTLHARNGSCF